MPFSRLAFLVAALATFPLAPALACPALNGTFACPAIASEPALTVTARTKPTGGDGAQYVFTYRIMGRDMPSQYDVAPTGLRKASDANSCDGNVLVHRTGSETVRLSLDPQGNFKREKNGRTEVVCPRTAD